MLCSCSRAARMASRPEQTHAWQETGAARQRIANAHRCWATRARHNRVHATWHPQSSSQVKCVCVCVCWQRRRSAQVHWSWWSAWQAARRCDSLRTLCVLGVNHTISLEHGVGGQHGAQLLQCALSGKKRECRLLKLVWAWMRCCLPLLHPSGHTHKHSPAHLLGSVDALAGS